MSNDVSGIRQHGPSASPPLAWVWHRDLDRIPGTGGRTWFLAVVVAATIALYYVVYEGGAVSPLLLAQYHMPFTFYVYMVVIGNAAGAFASLIGGLGDRIGRANLVVWGLLVTGVLQLVVVPHMPTKVTFAVVTIAIYFVEGIVLVATPALIRDFSPQLGRGKAMGFWTLGPVAGSLLVSGVTGGALPVFGTWQSQYVISGAVCLGVWLIALFGLRELSPELRSQLMVSQRDRALIEARVRGIDVRAATASPWRQMLRWNIVGSAFAISVFLLIYYAAVGFFTLYFTTIFGLSTAQANGINAAFWAVNCVILVVVGIVSDLVRVRKPFMVLGAALAIASLIAFLTRATHPDTSYGTLILLTSLIAAGLGIAYAPWMASFTETVEARNPALMATGLAVWGWILRIVIAVSTALIPVVVTTVSILVEAPAVLAKVPKSGPVPPALSARVAEIKAAAAASPHQWQIWWWVCVGGLVVFVPFIFGMTGYWRTRSARRAADEHETRVQAELARYTADEQA
ncbi:MAG: MFS transporter [Streptosporangiaceae bacterium]